MSASSHPPFLGFQINERNGNSNGPLPLWSKELEAQSRRRSKKWSRRILMKRRAHLKGCRRPAYIVERRVRALRKLVPNNESVGLNGLFGETADYILALQTRVKVMQIVVKALSGSDE